MRRLLYYYYFRLYTYYSDGSNIPIFQVFIIMLMFAFFNVVPIVDLIFAVGVGLKFTYPIFKGINLIPLLLLIGLLYMAFQNYFIKSGVHDKILKEFDNETPTQKRNSKILVFVYYLSSIAFFVLVLFLRQEIRGY